MMAAAIAGGLTVMAVTGQATPPAQNQPPNPADVQHMIMALPTAAPAKPARPRQVLVLAHADEYVQ